MFQKVKLVTFELLNQQEAQLLQRDCAMRNVSKIMPCSPGMGVRKVSIGHMQFPIRVPL